MIKLILRYKNKQLFRDIKMDLKKMNKNVQID